MAKAVAVPANNNRGFPKSSTYQWVDAVKSEERARKNWEDVYGEEFKTANRLAESDKATSFPHKSSGMYGWHVEGSNSIEPEIKMQLEVDVSVSTRDFALPFILDKNLQERRSTEVASPKQTLSSTASPNIPSKIMQMDRAINYRKPPKMFDPANLW